MRCPSTRKYCILRPSFVIHDTISEAKMTKAKKRVFSIVKAVKQNARDRVGQPPPEKVIPDPKQKAAAKPKHKETLADLLQKSDAD